MPLSLIALEEAVTALTTRVTVLEAEAIALRATATLIEKKRAWMMEQLQEHHGGTVALPNEPTIYP